MNEKYVSLNTRCSVSNYRIRDKPLSLFVCAVFKKK